MLRWLTAAVATLALCAQAGGQPRVEPDDCHQTFEGSYRAAVKLREPGLNYPAFKNGDSITVSQWFNELCRPLDDQLPRQAHSNLPIKPRTNTPPLKGIEELKVTLRGYLVAVRSPAP